ncbi:hypothetical protein [Ascidiaceihabitans sp.]|uniref:hypothetical protein n=1 Tax=Ascidiaceihabitans sp. TaxID=1872644 RepID=UPI003297ABED
MVVNIRPDPKHPRGGFAEITIEGATAASDPVGVAVYNSYQQKWLGPEGWQPNRAELPARAATQDGGALRLIVGPDIVNQLEEDTPVRIEVGGVGFDTYWPDDINAGPDEAVVGDIGGTGAAPLAKKPMVVVAEPDPVPEDVMPDPSDGLEEEIAADALEDDAGDHEDWEDEEEEEERRPRWRLLLILLALLAVAAIVANYVLFGMEDAAQPEEPAPAPAPETSRAAVADGCDVGALASMQSQGFTAMADKLRSCGSAVSPDGALGLVEQGAAANDADALNLFGALYDIGVTEKEIEGTIGLTFADDPARAADYYARAINAGSTQAQSRLQAVCRRLLLKTDTLSASAREDHCQ